VETIIKTR